VAWTTTPESQAPGGSRSAYLLRTAPPAIAGTAAVTATLDVNTTADSSPSNATGQETTTFRNQHNRMSALGGGGALVAFLFFGLPSRR